MAVDVGYKGFLNEPDVGYRNFFIPRANFKGFFNPRDKEISIPDINGHSENLFLFEFIYAHPALFSRFFCLRCNNYYSFLKKIVKSSSELSPGKKSISHPVRNNHFLPGDECA